MFFTNSKFFTDILQKWRNLRHQCISTSAYSKQIDRFFTNFDSSLLFFNKKPQINNLILSFTSFPARIKYVKYTLFSILQQSLRPEKIILWLSKEEFPQGEKGIPDILQRFYPFNFEIRFINENYRSYKKLFYALKEYPDSTIVSFDDDIFYKKNWLALLYNNHLLYPKDIVAHRTHNISFNNKRIDFYKNWGRGKSEASFLNFSTGAGGILYPPQSLFKDALNHELFLKLCPAADDIWFYVMALLKKTKIRKVKNGYNKAYDFDYIYDPKYKNIPKLTDTNIAGDQNDIQLKNALEYYNLYDSFYQQFGGIKFQFFERSKIN
jgi:hypothetical protein